MTTREDAEKAIQRWRALGLLQRVLASKVGVKEATLSHIAHEPGWTASQRVYRRICETVDLEVANRITSIPMEVVALCHGDSAVLDPPTADAIIQSIKLALMQHNDGGSVAFPPNVKGALIRLGQKQFGMYLVVVSTASEGEEKIAVAHELEHIRLELLASTQIPFKAPRSLF